ncbi:polysaccharide deacetylase family protein [Chromobacterium vaccinii]|uniref:polysaccharide deacetylase family protein n=1 Tax=Chromobacterium vaccinii TaxID=1108595 RepID=UPI001E53E909|nr:polysaccharide deacetylase family protein [Chromobacterium vaccinii]MCD4485724.1 polysaccharide deacetylase family protein [Chromobacterium vaccinii]
MKRALAINRRQFLASATAGGASLAMGQGQAWATTGRTGKMTQSKHEQTGFWPGDTRLVISISMQFEAGAQPERGAGGPFPPLDPKYPDLPMQTWYDYGVKEGIPRMLDLWDRTGVKVTSHMVGQAVDRNPRLAREIVERGHEAAGHGQTWEPQYSMTPEQERAGYLASIASIERATGTRPIGFNAFWLRGTPNTLGILQELGFAYHIDDISRDEPFTVPVNGKPFMVVPYTLRNNDIVRYDSPALTVDGYLADLKAEFDLLYQEAGHRRRMMSISTHDRISGTPARVKALETFIRYAQGHPGVRFMRKDEIARFALTAPGVPTS